MDDLYQETMVAAVEYFCRNNYSGNPKSLLMVIATDKWKKHKRKNARRQRITPEDYSDNEEEW